MNSRFGPTAALLAALVTNASLLGCGDGPVSQARAQIDPSPAGMANVEAPSAGPGAARVAPYPHIRPMLIDDRIDMPEQSDSQG